MSTYSTRGKTTLAPEVIHTIARLTVHNVPGVSRMVTTPTVQMNRLFKKRPSEGVLLDIQDDVVYADIYVAIKDGFNIRDVSRAIQQQVSRAISEMVGMQVGRVNVHVEDIDFPAETEAK